MVMLLLLLLLRVGARDHIVGRWTGVGAVRADLLLAGVVGLTGSLLLVVICLSCLLLALSIVFLWLSLSCLLLGTVAG